MTDLKQTSPVTPARSASLNRGQSEQQHGVAGGARGTPPPLTKACPVALANTCPVVQSVDLIDSHATDLFAMLDEILAKTRKAQEIACDLRNTTTADLAVSLEQNLNGILKDMDALSTAMDDDLTDYIVEHEKLPIHEFEEHRLTKRELL